MIVAAAPESRCTIPYGPPVCATSYVVQRRASSGRVLGQFRALPSHASVNPTGRHPPVGRRQSSRGHLRHRRRHRSVRQGLPRLSPPRRTRGRVDGCWDTGAPDELDQTANWAAVTTGGSGTIFLADDFNHRIEKRATGGRVLARWSIGTLFPSPLECSPNPLARVAGF